MPWNGSGVFTRLYNWVADRDNGVDIMASRVDGDADDIVQGLMNCLTRDGQTVPVANLPMRGYRFTGAGAGVNSGDFATIGQLGNGSFAANFQSLTLAGTLTVSGASTLSAVTASSLTVGGQLTTTELTVTDRAAIYQLDFGRSLATRTGYIDGNTGNIGTTGALIAQGVIQGNGSRVIVEGGSAPSFAMFNTAGGGPYAVFNAAGYLGFGPCDGSGNPTAFFQWIDGSGNVSMGYNLTVNGIGTFAGALNSADAIVSRGANAAFAFEDRAAPGQNWLLYANAGLARLWFGGDRLTVSSAGDLSVREDVTVGRNLQVLGSAAISGPLHVVGYATFDNGANISNVSLSGPVYASGDITSGGAFHAAAGSNSTFATITAGTINFNGGYVNGDLTTAGALHASTGTSTFATLHANDVEGDVVRAGSGGMYCAGDMGITGNLTVDGLINGTTVSDRLVKRNIERWRPGLAEVLRLEPVRFEYNGRGGTTDDGRARYGLVANDVVEVLPELVGEKRVLLRPGDDPTVIRTLDPAPLVYVLVNAVQQLAARLDGRGL
jgi:hypothetical protein